MNSAVIRSIIGSIIIVILVTFPPFCALAASDGSASSISQKAMSQESAAIVPNDFKTLDDYDYEKIDQHALNTPPSAESSVESLASYLAVPARNEREKARSIFRWITKNIDYNVAGYFSGSYGAANSSDLLKTRKSVCDGYSDLFESLARQAGLDAVRIAGYGKGYGYKPGENISGQSNHAWNAVKINGSWYLVDCTWGAGYIDEDKKYVREFDDHYFMTPPAEFVYDHFPDESRWQLTDKPITKSEFERRVHVKSGFFNLGLRLGSHGEGTIKAETGTSISIYAPDNVLLIAKLDYADGKRPSSATGLGSYSFVQREQDRYDIYAKFPTAGSYVLRAYAKQKDDPGEYSDVIEYRIEAAAGTGENAGFPMTYGKFTEAGAYLFSPLEGRLKSGATQRFKLRVPGAMNVSVINGEEWHYLEQRADLFEGNMTPAKGDVLVCARFLGEKWDGLVKYSGYDN